MPSVSCSLQISPMEMRAGRESRVVEAIDRDLGRVNHEGRFGPLAFPE